MVHALQCYTIRNCKRKLTTKMVLNVGHALLPNTDLRTLSAKIKTLGTQIAKANMAMMRSLSNLV